MEETINVPTATEKFGATRSTWFFFFLVMVTSGFYWFHWFINTIQKVSKICGKEDKLSYWIIIQSSASFVLILITDIIAPNLFLYKKDLEILLFIVVIGLISIAIHVSYKFSEILQEYFIKTNQAIEVKKIWSALFPGYYQYYLLHNQDEIMRKTAMLTNNIKTSIISDLERLSNLKANGSISEEEYQKQKNILLNINKA